MRVVATLDARIRLPDLVWLRPADAGDRGLDREQLAGPGLGEHALRSLPLGRDHEAHECSARHLGGRARRCPRERPTSVQW